MKYRMLLFLGTVILVLVSACFYMARRSLVLAPALQRHQGLIWSCMVAFLVLQFGVPLSQRLLGIRISALYWLSYLSLSLVSTYFLYLAGADCLQALSHRFLGAAVGSWALLTAVCLTVISAGIGFTQCYLPIRTKQIEVSIQGLPDGLEGFRIAQISDLHLGPLLPVSRVARIVTRTNDLSPDLIAVTGDLADGSVEQERDCLVELGKLQAVHGVRFVTGNHEYYSGVQPWLEAVRNLGWKTLVNQCEILQHRESGLAVIGLPDPASRGEGEGPDLQKAMAGLPPEATKLLLYHQPLDTAAAARAGIQVQLSGHTHGGQYFPWSPIVRLFFEHPLGLHRVGRMWLYTSPGTGFWGPPNRFLVPPEITLITLKKE
jgi:uncharacterized protein